MFRFLFKNCCFFFQADITTNTTIEEFCQKQIGIEKEELKVSQLELVEKKSEEFSENYYCYAFCVFNELGVINDKGVFSIEKYKKEVNGKADEECLMNVPAISECIDVALIISCE